MNRNSARQGDVIHDHAIIHVAHDPLTDEHMNQVWDKIPLFSAKSLLFKPSFLKGYI